MGAPIIVGVGSIAGTPPGSGWAGGAMSGAIGPAGDTLPSGKSTACLTNTAEVNQLVQMNGDTTTQYPEFTGTPSFTINGKMLKETATWDKLEPQLRDALGS